MTTPLAVMEQTNAIAVASIELRLFAMALKAEQERRRAILEARGSERGHDSEIGGQLL